MASRALWKGQLRLSLVSIPVELHSATRSGARISFRQIHKPSGKPIRYEKVVPGVGPVDADDIVKGYEYEKDNYVLLDPEEVEAIKLESKKTFELVQFVGACEISPLYFDKPYYLVPTDELAEDAYRVVRDALRQAEKIGIGQITLRGREYLAAVKACGDGLLLETLHYADEIRKADPLFSGIEDETVDAELLDVATALIQKKTSPFDAASFQDNYSEAMHKLIDARLHNRRSKRVSTEGAEEPRPSGDNVIDLMAVLKKSLANSKKQTPASGRKSGGTSKKKTTAKKKSGTRKKRSSDKRSAKQAS
jgi:DNA end-binding protein Ku